MRIAICLPYARTAKIRPYHSVRTVTREAILTDYWAMLLAWLDTDV